MFEPGKPRLFFVATHAVQATLKGNYITVTFKPFNLDPRIMSGVDALGYEMPTPIQLQAIPPVMQGRDVMGLAQTGTGKTAAFVLPILQRLINGPRGYVRALI